MKDVVKRRADLGIKDQTFNTDFNGMTLFVNHVAPKGGHLEGVFVYDLPGRGESPDRLCREWGPELTTGNRKPCS